MNTENRKFPRKSRRPIKKEKEKERRKKREITRKMSVDLEWTLFVKASSFAAIKHRDQRRKVGDIPYINHPLGVAHLLLESGEKNVLPLVAAVLHDTIEDTNATRDEIEREFGPEVLRVVLEVTDDKSLSADQRKRHQVEHARHSSREAKLVKLADKLYNMSDLLTEPPKKWTVKRIQGYFVWGRKVIEGIRGTNAILEARIDRVLQSTFTLDGVTHSALPQDTDLDVFLEEYYEMMKGSSANK